MPLEQKIETHSSLDPISAEWEALAVRLGAPPFERPGWFSAWLEGFGDDGLSIITLRRDGTLAGVLPVLAKRGTVISATNWHTPGFEPVAVDIEAETSLFEALFAGSPRRVDLSFLSPESALRLRDAGAGRGFATRVIARSPYIEIDQPWDAYWEGLSRNHRGNVRRRRRRLEELGVVELEMFEGGEGLGERLDESFRLEAASWKGERGTAIAASSQTRVFYECLCEWAAEAGLLRLGVLRLDGRMIAFHLSLETDEAHYLLKLGYDVDLASVSPGTVLTAAMVKHSFDAGLRRCEFLGDDEPYKLRWTEDCHQFVQGQSFAHTPAGLIDQIAQTKGRAIARRLTRRGRR